MRFLRDTVYPALALLLFFTVLCGGVYTLLVTAAAQLFWPQMADGGMVLAADGSRYTTALGQPYQQPGHLWGRPQAGDMMAFSAADGQPLFYAEPDNRRLSEERYQRLVQQRAVLLQALHPEMAGQPVPLELVTSSGSGLDPDISPAAAQYQVKRLARTTGHSEDEIQAVIDRCTEHKLWGIFGAPRVHVTQVNLLLDGKL